MNDSPTETIMVSIFCGVYNQKKYVKRALQGFVSQKCNFKFEVLIHDDASTDGSQEIIKEFEQEYSGIIKPIYQKENQHSLHKNYIFNYQLPRAQGKYIAICEGDDCWIDEYKLQKQVDYMESHPDCSICATNGFIHFVNTGKDDDFVKYMSDKKHILQNEMDLTIPELIHFSVPTASFLLPKRNYYVFPDTYRRYCFAGDKRLLMYSASLGYLHYFNEKTVVYNSGVPNSATTRKKSKAEELRINRSYVNLYIDLDSFTDFKYHDYIFSTIITAEQNILVSNYSEYKKKACFRTIYKSLSFKKKIAVLLKRMRFFSKMYYLVKRKK